MIRKSLTGLLFLSIILGTFSFRKQDEIKDQIHWMTMEEAVVANKKEPKKIFFDVYTDWCGWCKRMDATTFQHPEIVKYMNENYYAVKFDAESSKEIIINGKKYGSSDPTKSRAPHQFAVEMLQGRMSYPSFAVYNEKLENIGIIPGFQTAQDLETVLNYFGTNSHKSTYWSTFNQNFKGKVQ